MARFQIKPSMPAAWLRHSSSTWRGMLISFVVSYYGKLVLKNIMDLSFLFVTFPSDPQVLKVDVITWSQPNILSSTPSESRLAESN